MQLDSEYVMFCAEMAYNETIMEHVAFSPIGINLVTEGVGDILSGFKNWIKSIFDKLIGFLKKIKEKIVNIFKKKEKSEQEQSKSKEAPKEKKKEEKPVREGFFKDENGNEYIYDYDDVLERLNKINSTEVYSDLDIVVNSKYIAGIKDTLGEYISAISGKNIKNDFSGINAVKLKAGSEIIGKGKKYTEDFSDEDILIRMGFSDHMDLPDLGMIITVGKLYSDDVSEKDMEKHKKQKDIVLKAFTKATDQFKVFPNKMDKIAKEAEKNKNDIIKQVDKLSGLKLSKTQWDDMVNSAKSKDMRDMRDEFLRQDQKEFDAVLKKIKTNISVYVTDVSSFTSKIAQISVKALNALNSYKKKLGL